MVELSRTYSEGVRFLTSLQAAWHFLPALFLVLSSMNIDKVTKTLQANLYVLIYVTKSLECLEELKWKVIPYFGGFIFFN